MEKLCTLVCMVALFTRAWIEMLPYITEGRASPVALFTRAWIEILCPAYTAVFARKSPSLRGRGLKYIKMGEFVTADVVALFTRAWIEIGRLPLISTDDKVALFTRAWIEIRRLSFNSRIPARRPLYEGVD